MGLILLDKTDRKGLPNGATYAAYVKFPTNLSRFLILIDGELRASLIRAIYFFCFFSESLHDFRTESYKKPTISIFRAGEKHFSGFIIAPVSLPTVINHLNNRFAFRLSASMLSLERFGPPKKSSM